MPSEWKKDMFLSGSVRSFSLSSLTYHGFLWSKPSRPGDIEMQEEREPGSQLSQGGEWPGLL